MRKIKSFSFEWNIDTGENPEKEEDVRMNENSALRQQKSAKIYKFIN